MAKEYTKRVINAIANAIGFIESDGICEALEKALEELDNDLIAMTYEEANDTEKAVIILESAILDAVKEEENEQGTEEKENETESEEADAFPSDDLEIDEEDEEDEDDFSAVEKEE